MTSIVELFQKWVGWGWGAAVVIWIGGAAVILTVVQRYFLERTGSRRVTIVLFLVWGLAVIGIAARLFGFAPPSGN